MRFTKIFPAWKERHPSEDLSWEDDWRNIIFIKFPEGLFSWHIHDFEYDYFNHLEFREGNSWDGLETMKKYEMMRSFEWNG